MKRNLLRRKEKATRQERCLSEIDRLICWKELARTAEDCLEEMSSTVRIERDTVETLMRLTVLNKCFGLATSEIASLQTAGATPQPDPEELERFFQVLAGCSRRFRIFRELNCQLAKVGITLNRQAISSLM